MSRLLVLSFACWFGAMTVASAAGLACQCLNAKIEITAQAGEMPCHSAAPADKSDNKADADHDTPKLSCKCGCGKLPGADLTLHVPLGTVPAASLILSLDSVHFESVFADVALSPPNA